MDSVAPSTVKKYNQKHSVSKKSDVNCYAFADSHHIPYQLTASFTWILNTPSQ
jgi:hypothetical protein